MRTKLFNKIIMTRKNIEEQKNRILLPLYKNKGDLEVATTIEY